MTLLVDIGNTRIKWGYLTGDRIEHKGAVLHCGRDPNSVLDAAWSKLDAPQVVWVANVAGQAVGRGLAGWVKQHWSLTPNFVATSLTAHGLVNAYPCVRRLGVDRWVAMIGARQSCSGLLCVVDCGTAVTIDGVTEDGRHLGGLILPGLKLMRESLAGHTGDLPRVELGNAEPFANNTEDAIYAGTLYAIVGAVEQMCGAMANQFDGKVLRILTGGDAEIVCSQMHEPYLVQSDLVLRGLAALARGGDLPNTP